MKSILPALLLLSFCGQRIAAAADENPTADAAPRILIEAVVFEVALPKATSSEPSKSTSPSSAILRDFIKDCPMLWFTNLVPVVMTNDIPQPDRDEVVYVARLGSSCNATIAGLMVARRDINVVQKPRVETSSGTPASILFGEAIPGSGHHSNVITPASLPPKSTLTLDLTPHAGPEGLRALDIRVNAEWFVGETFITNVGLIPEFITTHSRASATVRAGDILMIGGAYRTSAAKRPARMLAPKHLPPGAAPKLGRTELVVLVCPTLVSGVNQKAAQPLRRYPE